MRPVATIVLDSRTTLKNKKHPLKIRVGMGKNESRKYGIGLSFTKREYETLLKNQRKEGYKDTWSFIMAKLEKADSIIDGLMPFFRFGDFKERFYDTPTLKVKVETSSLLHICQLVQAKYRAKKQYSMSVKMGDSVSSILKFVNTNYRSDKKENIAMRSITPAFCREYEEHMYTKSKTNSRNGAGINLRHIRILFNEAINEGLIPKEWYPFKRQHSEKSEYRDPYVIPNERKVKDYLNENEIVQLAEAKTFNTQAQRKAHWGWLVSFYCNGANAADFLRFKFRDIKDDFIYFYREKIKNSTRTDRKLIKIYVSPEFKQLIEEVGNPPALNNFIFPCYTDGMTEEERYEARKKFTTGVSKSMKFLVSHLGIKKRVRLGNARHSLANVLKKNGVDREVVKDLFGHTSILTTDNYYESFNDDKHKEIASKYISVSKLSALDPD